MTRTISQNFYRLPSADLGVASPLGTIHSELMAQCVMTTLQKVSDFCYFLPFLFSLYHYQNLPERPTLTHLPPS